MPDDLTFTPETSPELADEIRRHHHHHDHFHEQQVKAFELYEPAEEQGFPDTEGVDPGPWYFWFKAATEQAPDDSANEPQPAE